MFRIRSVIALGCLGVSGGCSPDDKPSGACDTSSVGAGESAANVDDIAWASTASWSLAGSSVQVVTAESDGWRFTLVAQLSTTGVAVGDAVSAGDYPIEVTLKSGTEGGFVTAYATGDSSSYASADAAGGAVTLLGEDDDGLSICGGFEAANEAGELVVVEDFAARASPL